MFPQDFYVFWMLYSLNKYHISGASLCTFFFVLWLRRLCWGTGKKCRRWNPVLQKRNTCSTCLFFSVELFLIRIDDGERRDTYQQPHTKMYGPLDSLAVVLWGLHIITGKLSNGRYRDLLFPCFKIKVDQHIWYSPRSSLAWLKKTSLSMVEILWYTATHGVAGQEKGLWR